MYSKCGVDKQEHTERYLYRPVNAWDTTKELLEVDAVGGGCLLVKNSIFKRLKLKLPKYKEENESVPIKDCCMYFDHTPYHTEDMVFCRYVREILNENIYVDPSLMCGHLQKKIVEAKDFVDSKKLTLCEMLGFEKVKSMTVQEIVEFDTYKWKEEHKE
jgi:hypothetical protein